MKKTIAIIVFIIAVCQVQAQDTVALRKTILGLLQDAKTDFSKTKGTAVQDTSWLYTFFKARTVITGSNSEIIVNKDNSKRFVADFDLTLPANQKSALLAQNVVRDIMFEVENKGNHYISYENDINKMAAGYTRQYLLTDNDEIVIEIEKAPTFLSINIYGQSWGGKVSEGIKRPRLF